MPFKNLSKRELISQIKKLQRQLKTIEENNTIGGNLLNTKEIINSFYKNSINIISIIDVNAKILDINRVLKGYKKQDTIGKSMYDYVAPEYKNLVKKSIAYSVKYKKPSEYIMKGSGANNTITYYFTKIVPILKNKKVVMLVVDGVDISKEQNTLNLLKESEQRLKVLSDAALEGLAIHKDGKVIEINKAITTIFNDTKKNILGKPIFEFIHPSFHSFAINTIKKKDEKVYEMKMLRKNKVPFWAELSAREIEYKGERARVVAIRDITKEKEYQEQTEKSKALYKSLIDASPNGVFIHQNGKVLFANPKTYSLLETKKNVKYIGKSIFEFMLPKYRKEVQQRMIKLAKKENVPPIEIEIKTFKGKIKKIEVWSKAIEYDGQPAVLAIFNDQTIKHQLIKDQLKLQLSEESNKKLQKEIDERKKVEKILHNQSAMLNAVFQSAAHIMWTLDSNYNLLSFNNNFKKYIEKNYEITPKIGMSLVEGEAIVSSVAYNNFWKEKIDKCFKKAPQHFEAKFVGNKSNIVWHEIFLNPIVNDNGVVDKISGIAHDITLKKTADEEIEHSLREKEILLKEVHHRVKNNLQLVSSILNLQSSYVKDENTLAILKDSQNRIKSMSFIHESLYRTKDFSNINFAEYAAEISKNLLHSYSGAQGDIKLNLDIQNVFLNLDVAIPCGLIINEILSNSFKYAFTKEIKNKQIDLKIETKGNELIVLIGDNGVGLPSHIDFKETDSLGLQIVVTLIDQLAGKIELEKFKKGTNYIIRFKYNQTKNALENVEKQYINS